MGGAFGTEVLGVRRGQELGLVYEAVVNGVKRELETVRNAEFIEDIVQMVLHRLFANEEFLADFAISEALGYELDDLFFAVA